MGSVRLKVPTPFNVGKVNCYIFEDYGLTLLDPGPATSEAYATLDSDLKRYGHTVDEVERVLITHPHMDHFGAANRIKNVSGAHVLAHADATERIADPDGFWNREQTFFRPFLISMGVPEQLVDAVIGLPESYEEFREPVEVDRELQEADIVNVGYDLHVEHTPGHVLGSVCYLSRAEDAVYTGDHVLNEISPNPLLILVPGQDDERTRSLPRYLSSLKKLRSFDVSVGYAGHRDTIQNLEERIDEIIEHHHDRKDQIAAIVADQEPISAYRILQEMFPDLPITEIFSGISEVIGHLDLLEDENNIRVESHGDVHYYETF